jgi:hypothetical protein
MCAYLQHTLAYVSIRRLAVVIRRRRHPHVRVPAAYDRTRQHTSAYVSVRQHTSAYVSIRSTSSICGMYAYLTRMYAYLTRMRASAPPQGSVVVLLY